MKTTLQHFFAIILLASFTSCSVFRPVDMSKVRIGMSKAQVEAALKIKPHAIISAGLIEESNNIAEDVEYADAYQQYRYVLTFVNDKLQSWHRHTVYSTNNINAQAGR